MLKLESYEQHEHHLPASGKFIIAQFSKDWIIVYQAFKDSIAEYAVANQKFGGPDYDFNRMTWLKPSFLWMMYYSGWAQHQNQENVLAIKMKRSGFDEILEYAVMSTFYKEIYGTSWLIQIFTCSGKHITTCMATRQTVVRLRSASRVRCSGGSMKNGSLRLRTSRPMS